MTTARGSKDPYISIPPSVCQSLGAVAKIHILNMEAYIHSDPLVRQSSLFRGSHGTAFTVLRETMQTFIVVEERPEQNLKCLATPNKQQELCSISPQKFLSIIYFWSVTISAVSNSRHRRLPTNITGRLLLSGMADHSTTTGLKNIDKEQTRLFLFFMYCKESSALELD
jgi:hypothetical protein